MVTYFNKKDLVNFGKFLLSDERTASLAATESEIPLEERLKNVYHSDVEKFLNLQRRELKAQQTHPSDYRRQVFGEWLDSGQPESNLDFRKTKYRPANCTMCKNFTSYSDLTLEESNSDRAGVCSKHTAGNGIPNAVDDSELCNLFDRKP